MTTAPRPGLGIALMVGATFVFAVQDGISRYLADVYNVPLTVMIRYWFLALFVTWLAGRQPGGISGAARPRRPWLQAGRGLLLVCEIMVTVWAFVLLGLAEAHAIFATYPLIIAALAGPMLGERAGWRRWAAIAAGFIGVLVILRPGTAVFSPAALVPLGAAFLFALYGVLTRMAARADGAIVSFVWTGWTGAVAATLIGAFFWEPMTPGDSAWMAVLCLTGALAHYLLIRAYDLAEASGCHGRPMPAPPSSSAPVSSRWRGPALPKPPSRSTRQSGRGGACAHGSSVPR